MNGTKLGEHSGAYTRFVFDRAMSKPANAAALRITVGNAAPLVDVLVMATDGGAAPPELTGAGFADSGVTGTWRDGGMNVVPWRVYSTRAAAGAVVSVPSVARDYVVLLRAAP